jgi:hypothetical protein
MVKAAIVISMIFEGVINYINAGDDKFFDCAGR